MKLTKAIAAVAFFVISATASQAQTASKPSEPSRIKQGVKSGELTKHETKTLVGQQKDIRQDRKEAKADGTVTATEKADIKQDKRQASRSIYRKKHNAKVRN